MGRRAFLAGGATALGALTACSGGGDRPSAEGATTEITRLEDLEGDLATFALLASLENLAVALYQAARELFADEELELEPLPESIATYVDLAQSQHEEHARAWNGILTGAGRQPVAGVNLTLKTGLEPLVANSRDYVGISSAFLELESIAAATYLSSIDALVNNATLRIAASIHPVELQHVAFLNLILDHEPVPAAFATADGARSTTDTVG